MEENERVAETESSRTDTPVETTTGPQAPSKTLAGIDWIELAISLREPEIEILKLVYLPEPASRPFRDVYIRLDRLGCSRRTTRRKMAFLAELGLVTRVYSILGFIGPVYEQTANVHRLLHFIERRRQYPVPGGALTSDLLRLITEVKEANER